MPPSRASSCAEQYKLRSRARRPLTAGIHTRWSVAAAASIAGRRQQVAAPGPQRMRSARAHRRAAFRPQTALVCASRDRDRRPSDARRHSPAHGAAARSGGGHPPPGVGGGARRQPRGRSRAHPRRRSAAHRLPSEQRRRARRPRGFEIPLPADSKRTRLDGLGQRFAERDDGQRRADPGRRPASPGVPHRAWRFGAATSGTRSRSHRRSSDLVVLRRSLR